MSNNAQRHIRIPFIKQSNQACMLLDHAPTPTTPTTHPTRFGCVAYITGFGFDYRTPKFVPVLRKADAIPAWKAPTLRSSHTL